MISRRYRYVSKGGPASTGWGSIRPIVTPRTLALVEMSSIRAGTSFFSGTSRRITASSAEYSSTLRRRSSMEDLRRKVEEYSALLAVMRRLVPEKNEVPALIDDISTKANVRGVTIGRIEPQPVEAGPPFDTYRYRLEIIGHYDQLGESLSDIASLPRIIVPQDVILKAAAQQAQKLGRHARRAARG